MAAATRDPSPQESFWQGEFGDGYTRRNDDARTVAANTRLFAQVLARTENVTSVLELGANIGMNLRAVRALLPDATLDAVEINSSAATALRDWGEVTVHEGSLLTVELEGSWDLTLCKGVLIHLAPEQLELAYDVLHERSSRYICVAEYFNPSPVEIPYREHRDRLFKRDFAGEMLQRHPGLRLVDYGFIYHGDPNFALDDITWFLMERRDT